MDSHAKGEYYGNYYKRYSTKKAFQGRWNNFKNKRGGWTARYVKKGLPAKEFTGDTKTEVKEKLDDWKVKVSVQDAITTNVKVSEYAKKFLFRKTLAVEAGQYKQSSLDRIERTYNCHIKGTEAENKTFSNLTSDDISATISAKKDYLSYSSLKKIYLFWSAKINHAIDLDELPKSYKIMKRVILPAESVLPVETKEIQIIPPEIPANH